LDNDILFGDNFEKHLKDLKDKRLKFAEDLDFEKAAKIREEIRRLEETSLKYADDPMLKQKKSKKKTRKGKK
jgi:Helicase subunit of the DNA excision repair complex